MDEIKRPTEEELIAHLKAGTEKCLVCGLDPVHGNWTDMNGEIRCRVCGTTYSVLGARFTDEFFERTGLKKEDVAQKYCNCYREVPILRAYWNDTSKKIPSGTFLGAPDRNGPTEEETDAFISWLGAHAGELEIEFAESFKWDVIKTSAAENTNA